MQNIISRLQPHTVRLYNIKDADISEEIVDARSLLVPARFDLFAKLYYISRLESDKQDALNVYNEHIKVFNPDLKEPGREDKNGYEDFINIFNCLIEVFRNQQFDSFLSLVPITDDNTILDGAHRVSALAYFDRKVGVARIRNIKPKASFDYHYFKKRGMSWKVMDKVALEMTKWVDGMCVICIPFKKGCYKELFSYIEKTYSIAYEKNIISTSSDYKLLIEIFRRGGVDVYDLIDINSSSLLHFGLLHTSCFLFFPFNSPTERELQIPHLRQRIGEFNIPLYLSDNPKEVKVIAEYLLDDKKRKQWRGKSLLTSVFEDWAEYCYYLKHVKFLKLKVSIAKILHY